MTNRTYKQLQISNYKDFLTPKETSKDQLKLNKYIITHRLKIGDQTMKHKPEKVKEAFQIKANLGDREIRMIRASAMGISLYEYEKTLRAIGRDDFWSHHLLSFLP